MSSYFDIKINKESNTFYILETDQPEGVQTLEKIEQVISKNLNYSPDRNDQFSKLDPSKLIQVLKKKSSEIVRRYDKKFFRILKGKVENLDKKINFSEFFNLPNEIIEKITSLLTLRDLGRLAKVNKQCREIVANIIVNLGKRYNLVIPNTYVLPKENQKDGFTIVYRDANNQLKELYGEVSEFCKAIESYEKSKPQLSPRVTSLIVKKRNAVDANKTLEVFRNLNDPDLLFRILSQSFLYRGRKRLARIFGNQNLNIVSTDHHQEWESDLNKTLQLAIEHDAKNIIELALANGANITHRYLDGKSVLHHAVLYCSPENFELILKKSLEAGLDINKKDNSEPQQTALGYACSGKMAHASKVKLLIDKGAKVKDDPTLLFHAVRTGKADVVRTLIENGANVNFSNIQGETPLWLAIDKVNNEFNHDVIKLLLDNNADFNFANNRGMTLLHQAVIIGDLTVVEWLIDKGVDINRQNVEGKTALFMATQFDNLEIVKFLLKKGADPNLPDQEGTTPLHTAVTKRNISMVELLLQNEASVDIADNQGKSPLQREIIHNSNRMGSTNTISLSIINLLLDNGADIDQRDIFGRTLLHLTIGSNSEQTQLLLKRGANPDFPSREGMTPLHSAVLHRAYEIMDCLFKKHANPNLINHDGDTPLNIAINEMDYKGAYLLLDNNADPNIRNKYGKTILHYAVTQRDGAKIVMKLLEKGANPNLPDSNNQTPLDLASNRPKIKKMILAWLKKNSASLNQHSLEKLSRGGMQSRFPDPSRKQRLSFSSDSDSD